MIATSPSPVPLPPGAITLEELLLPYLGPRTTQTAPLPQERAESLGLPCLYFDNTGMWYTEGLPTYAFGYDLLTGLRSRELGLTALFADWSSQKEGYLKAEGSEAFDHVWFRAYEPSFHQTPGGDDSGWAATLSYMESTLLTGAAEVLSGALSLVVSGLLAQELPVEWRWGPAHRSTVCRLFDRLHVQIVAWKGKLYWANQWWSREGELQPPQETVFGRVHPDNAWLWALRQGLGGGALHSAWREDRGLGMLTLPQPWAEASRPGWRVGVDASDLTVPAEVSEELGRLLEFDSKLIEKLFSVTGVGDSMQDLRDAILREQPANEVVARVWQTLRSAAEAGQTSLTCLTWLLGPLAGRLLINLVVEDLETIRHNSGLLVKAFSIAEPDLSSVGGLGLDDDLEELARSVTPMILLGERFAEYSRGLELGARNPESGAPANIISESGEDGLDGVPWARSFVGTAEAGFEVWWVDMQPTVQAMMVADTAAEILSKLIELDDFSIALLDFVADEGPLGALIRQQLYQRGLLLIADVLGGVSPTGLIRYAYRQILTDIFLQSWSEVGGSVDCVWPVVTWMDSAVLRERVDAALGEAQTLATTTLGDFTLVVSVRAGLLPPALRAVEGGALGRLVDQLIAWAASGSSPPEALVDLLDKNDLWTVRAWLADAAANDLVNLKSRLQSRYLPSTE